MSFRSRSAASRFLFTRKKGFVRPLPAVLVGTLRTRDGHSAGKSDPSMPAKAEFPARATPRPAGRRRTGETLGIMVPLCSHYGAIYDYVRAGLSPAPLSASRPSQTISVGHFWLLMDVDLLIGLSLGETTSAVRWMCCVYVCVCACSLCALTRARFDGQYRNAVAGIIPYRRYWWPRISLTDDRC